MCFISNSNKNVLLNLNIKNIYCLNFSAIYTRDLYTLDYAGLSNLDLLDNGSVWLLYGFNILFDWKLFPDPADSSLIHYYIVKNWWNWKYHLTFESMIWSHFFFVFRHEILTILIYTFFLIVDFFFKLIFFNSIQLSMLIICKFM